MFGDQVHSNQECGMKVLNQRCQVDYIHFLIKNLLFAILKNRYRQAVCHVKFLCHCNLHETSSCFAGDPTHGRVFSSVPIGTVEPYTGNYVLKNPTFLFRRTISGVDNKYIVLSTYKYV